MKNLRLFVIALAAGFALAANAAREERPVNGFHAIAAGVNVELEVIQDGTESLALEGDADALASVETAVRNGTLELRYQRDARMSSPPRIKAVVHARDMDAIALSGVGKVHSPSLRAETMTLAVSGSGDMDIATLAAKKAQLAISGSGNLHLAGHVDEMSARISGSGNIDAAKLEAQRGDVKIAGAGRATVWARRQLATAISGVGTVRYYGDPTLAKSIAGVGRVERVAANP
jgi:putative autotransporter adhesin-like protein